MSDTSSRCSAGSSSAVFYAAATRHRRVTNVACRYEFLVFFLFFFGHGSLAFDRHFIGLRLSIFYGVRRGVIWSELEVMKTVWHSSWKHGQQDDNCLELITGVIIGINTIASAHCPSLSKVLGVVNKGSFLIVLRPWQVPVLLTALAWVPCIQNLLKSTQP